MSGPAAAVRQAWIDASVALGGDRDGAAAQAEELIRGYGEPVRHYHGLEHVASVLERVGELGTQLAPEELACVRAAAAAHDVVYRGLAGADERDSAAWAVAALAAVGADRAERVGELVSATATHLAGDDRGAAVLLDADLAVLASTSERYAAYVSAVRAEYAHVDAEQWRTGRGAVLADLLGRDRIYATEAGQRDWEAAARANLTAELSSLGGAPPAG